MGASTVAFIIHETVIVLWETLFPIHMAKPTAESFIHIASDYYERWNFPNCIGSIDGKHIRIKCPEHSTSLYYNYKHFYSIVLQGVADARYKFVCIDVGGYGHQADSKTFQFSDLYTLLTTNRLNIPENNELPGTSIKMPHVFIGDEAYPLLNNLMRPYSRACLTEETEYYNLRHSRARKTIECAFGIINAKWRILWKPIETNPSNADLIIKCICILHNVIIDCEGGEKQIQTTKPSEQSNSSRGKSYTRPSACATTIRNLFKDFFVQNKI